MTGAHRRDGVDAELLRLAEAFFACRVAFFDANDSHWDPAPGSAAAADAAALPSPDPRLDQPAGTSGFDLITEAVSSYLLVASGHLGGLAALHAAGEVVFPPGMLVRAVLENCARAMWILGDETSSPQDRLARAYLEDLLSAEEGKKNAGRLGPKNGDGHVQAAAAFKRLRNDVVALFPGATLEELNKGQLAGETLLKPEACVMWMYDFLHARTGSSIDERTGQGVYGFLSNMTHPTLYPVRQLREWHPAADHDGHMQSSLVVDVDYLERQASAAVVAFYNALSYVMGYYGWPRDAHDRLTAALDRLLPGTFLPE